MVRRRQKFDDRIEKAGGSKVPEEVVPQEEETDQIPQEGSCDKEPYQSPPS